MNEAIVVDNEWFAEMDGIHALLPDYTEAYIRMGRLYIRLIAEYTSDSDILLVGSFAKTDYLLKGKGADVELKRLVNDMRLRLTRMTETQSSGSFNVDFRTLCFFISLLTDVSVPESLSRHFPQKETRVRHHRLVEDYVRVVVNSWDDLYIYCTKEIENEDIRIRYAGEGQMRDTDNSYLADILYVGVMLNIIHPYAEQDGTLIPEFIILEPDFLVDVSTVVSCFDTFAKSPLLPLLKRMEPFSPTEPILLGNMASELLDQVLHEDTAHPCDSKQMQSMYHETVVRFFHRYAVGVMEVQPSADFHHQALLQYANICAAVKDTLPKQVKGYSRNKVIVEPTFFSEMLGLQGRMDMLQTDMRLLVEQKSGKGAYRQGNKDEDTPSYREQHYMQMLLYMAIVRYNFRQIYEENNRELYAFLLYSKYQHSLVGLGFAPELLTSLLEMRNRYVAQEREMTCGGVSAVMELTVDRIVSTDCAGRVLWERYQRPRLESLLSPLHTASPLEKAYFIRFYSFIAMEHRLAKMGNQTKGNSGFACAWLSSVDEKQQSGDILIGMEMLPPSVVSSYIDTVVLRHDGDAGNFRCGDIVVLYPYDPHHTPDLRRTMSFRATITEIGCSNVTLQLRNAQRDNSILFRNDGQLWSIEHDFMESSYSGLYRGLYSFLCAPKERKDLLLMQRQPVVQADVHIRGDYGRFNELQERIKNASDLFLIIGPPGTGKTSFGMLNTLQEQLLEEESRVLIVSYTNRAVDEICSKLYPDIDFIRIGGDASASPIYKEKMLGNVVAECSSVNELKRRIQETRVLVGTTSSVSAHLSILSMSPISLCIVDEASQILEPHLLPLMSLSCNGVSCIRKFVMIGDHKQLSAVVQQKRKESIVEDEALKDIGLTDCRNSLFERLLYRYRHDPSVCYMLTRQGRMHRDIARFPNVAFYGGKLEEVPLSHQLQESTIQRVRFIDVVPYHHPASDKVNMAEAEVIVSELCSIWESNKDTFSPEETVGVIVPYRNQISAIRNLLGVRLADPSHPLLQISIDTVERYQGSQRHYIIYAFTVQYQYQLRFLTETTFQEDGMTIDRKLNVAMTRALDYLIIIGYANLIGKWPLYRKLLQYISNDVAVR